MTSGEDGPPPSDGTAAVQTTAAAPPTTVICPPATKRRPYKSSAVEKVDGGVTVWGITVGSNCLVALPVFGTLFLTVGVVLTVISYGWVAGSGGGEDKTKRNKLYSTTNNGRLLGPICLAVSIVMFIATAVLRMLSTNARFRQTRVGFHCPVHGDFFPISPGLDPRKFSFSDRSINAETPWIYNCLNRLKADSQETLAVEEIPPQCPLNGIHGSLSPSPSISMCPTPKPFLVFTDSEHGACKDLRSGNTLFPDEPFGSIRSLFIPNDNLAVACFPVERVSEDNLNVPEDSWSHKRLSCPSLPSAGDEEFPKPVHKPLTPQVVKVTREIQFVTPIDQLQQERAREMNKTVD